MPPLIVPLVYAETFSLVGPATGTDQSSPVEDGLESVPDTVHGAPGRPEVCSISTVEVDELADHI